MKMLGKYKLQYIHEIRLIKILLWVIARYRIVKKKMVEPSMFPLVSNPKFNAKNSRLYFKISL